MKSKDYYNEIAKGYNELYGEEQLRKWDELKNLIEFKKTDVSLDLGSGTGIILPELSKMVKFIFAVDNSVRMIAKSPKLKNVKYVNANAEKLPFSNSYFDKVISLTMLQDVPNWDNVLKEIKRVTKGEAAVTFLKRNKTIEEVTKKIEKYFAIKKFLEEEKDFIFLLESLKF